MKVIFLDIDGVLNLYHDYLLVKEGKPSQRDKHGSSFHPHFVANLLRMPKLSYHHPGDIVVLMI